MAYVKRINGYDVKDALVWGELGINDSSKGLSVTNGGTGATTPAKARENLGITPANIGASPVGHTHDADDLGSHNHDASDITGTLSIEQGGTGATTAEQARMNLNITPSGIGASPVGHGHDVTDLITGVLPIARGGTEATTPEQAREKLGVAPAGFGLGEAVATAQDGIADNITKTGFYKVDISGITGQSGYAYGYHLQVDENTAFQRFEQALSNDNNITIQRHKRNGLWESWEYDNPPLEFGVEYRTTRKYRGQPLYCKWMALGQSVAGTASAPSTKTHEIGVDYSKVIYASVMHYSNYTLSTEFLPCTANNAIAYIYWFSGTQIKIKSTGGTSGYQTYLYIEYIK